MQEAIKASSSGIQRAVAAAVLRYKAVVRHGKQLDWLVLSKGLTAPHSVFLLLASTGVRLTRTACRDRQNIWLKGGSHVAIYYCDFCVVYNFMRL